MEESIESDMLHHAIDKVNTTVRRKNTIVTNLFAELGFEISMIYAHIAQIECKHGASLYRTDQFYPTSLHHVFFLYSALAERHSERRYILK